MFILCQRIFLLVALFLLSAMPITASPWPVPGPQLEPVFSPTNSTAGLPAPACWPVLRYERPLRCLVQLSKTGGSWVSRYERVTRRLRASLDVQYTDDAGFDVYHVFDKWNDIEPKGHPTEAEVTRRALGEMEKAIARRNGHSPYDVVFLDSPQTVLRDTALQEKLLEFVRSGGILVVCAQTPPAADAPLGKVWPARPAARGASSAPNFGGLQRADGPELSGIPVHRLRSSDRRPRMTPANGATQLSSGVGAIYLRKVCQGAILVVPMGPISLSEQQLEAGGGGYDQDDIWLRLWDQLLYTLAGGTQAIPAYTDLKPGKSEAPAGQDYVLPARLVNRSCRDRLALSIHVTTPHGHVVYAHEETSLLQPGAERSFQVRVPVARQWAAGLYPVYVTVGDAKTKRQLQQSLEYVPVTGVVHLHLASSQLGYRLGEDAHFALTASASAPWNGSLRFGVFDFRGRLLAMREKAVQLNAEAQRLPFSYHVVDDGVRADTLWARVLATRRGQTYARAEAKFYEYDPWSMRNEYQWSTWAAMVCAPPSLVPRAMRLMAFAGMNALGYPYEGRPYSTIGTAYAAERWGWRYYDEGIGMNTWNPVIDYDSDAEIAAELHREAQGALGNPVLRSAAFVLGSVGEEAGFKKGWGARYYWDKPVAPEKACKALQWYLKTKYPSLEALNAAWKSKFKNWDEIKLTKEFSGGPPNLDADGWAHPKASPVGAGVRAVSIAPYQDTANFYDWYYDKIVGIARRIFHDEINPVTLTMSSAPTIGSADYDVRQDGPSMWYESQFYSTQDGPEPGFGLMWGHFDSSVKTEDLFWGLLLTRSGHNDYWVDMPLMFNNDFTLTRATFALRRWTHRLAGHERTILDSRTAPSGVGILPANGVGPQPVTKYGFTPPGDFGDMTTSLKVALNQAGFGYEVITPKKLSGHAIVFAIGRRAVSPEQAEALGHFVEGGGTLVFTPEFACQTGIGAPQEVSPGCGLAGQWRFKVTKPGIGATAGKARLDGLGEAWRGLEIATKPGYLEQVAEQGWRPLATYPGGAPALLSRRLGKGRLVFLNAVYISHHYIQWVTPTDGPRKGFYRLVESLCEQAGARRTLRLEGKLDEVLHWAVKQFTDPTGRIRYVILRTSGEVPWTAGTLEWLGPEPVAYDILGGPVGQPSRVFGKSIPLVFRPGSGKFLAFTAAPVHTIKVEARSRKLVTGQPLRLTVHILDANGRPIPGSFPFECRVERRGAEIAGLHRSISLESGASMVINTALNDPAGQWRVVLTDGITGLSGSATIRVAANQEAVAVPPVACRGWPSEVEAPARLSSKDFIEHLRRLAALYRKDHSSEAWLTKQYLGYFYDTFSNTRHDLLRPLNEVDWMAYRGAIRQAVLSGATLILTGEDVGLDPRTGLATYPGHYGKQLPALAAALAGADWRTATPDGDTVIAALGKGRVILCRESIDAAGNTNPEIARWQQRWLAELKAGQDGGIRLPTPTLEKLRRWWVGKTALGAAPRTVSWFGDNSRVLKLMLDPAKPLGETFILAVPPTGKVSDLRLALSTTGTGKIVFDIGCDDVPDDEILATTQPAGDDNRISAIKWRQAMNSCLAKFARTDSEAYRDDSGWRMIPVRVTATSKVALTLRDLKLTVQ